MVCVTVLGESGWGGVGDGSGKLPDCTSFLTNHHKLGGLKTAIYSLIVLEARSLKSRCQQSHTFSEGSVRIFSFLFYLLVVANNPWYFLACGGITPVFASMSHDHPSSVCLCVQILSSYKDTSLWNMVYPNPE